MAEQKKKKKFPWGMVIYLASCMAIGVVIGIVMGEMDVDLDVDPLFLIGVMVLFVAAIYLHIIVHEAGHMLFGMLTGYRFLSYRVGSLMWEKGADGKVRFFRYSLAGTGGQCLMSPPEYNGGKYPYVWYNLGGAAVNLLLAALAGALLLLPMGKWMAAALWMLLLTGVLLGLTNGLPLPGNNVNNDGSNLVAISRSPEARRAFWLQMKINEQVAWGKRLRDLPEEYFQPVTPEARKNSMVASMDVMAASRQMDALNFDEAERMMRTLMGDKNVPGIYHNMMTFDLAWCELMADRPGESVEKLEDKAVKQFAKAMKKFPSILRTQYAVALLKEKDDQKAAGIRAQFDKAAQQYPHESEIIGERELMELTAEKAKEA